MLMPYYDRIHISKVIDVNKTIKSKECDICHFWYFLNEEFKLQSNVRNRCHHFLMMSINLSNVAILKIKYADYCCIITRISKNGATKLMQINN